jgi:cyclohexyl-isocyanide hydratase
MEFLEAYGALPTKTRVCVDRNRVSGGGVTAGIDFALTLASHLVDRESAEMIQLRLEYNPAPPFTSGSPDTAPPDMVARMRQINPSERRKANNARAAAALRELPVHSS